MYDIVIISYIETINNLIYVVLVLVDFDALPKNKEKKPLGNEVKITDKKYVRYKEGAERYSM